MQRRRRIGWAIGGLLAAVAAGVWAAHLSTGEYLAILGRVVDGRRRLTAPRLTAAAARARFLREHPGEQPLNHAIGRAAQRFHRTRPMGAFVLGLTTPGNDCSDFCAACVDEGLGVGARFNRGSTQHLLGERPDLFETFWWRPGFVLLPGDQLAVAHSPHYEPYPGACWHVGIVGADGWVYDFSKLRRWRAPRYGRHEAAWFLQHSRGHHEALVERLHWRYRYRVAPLPAVTGQAG